MGIVINMYKKNFLQRYDKDEAIPYYAGTDFPGLCCEESSFRNTAGIDIRYFIYSYEGYDKDKLILFCPGMGPGHTAYLAEIETLCQAGLRVLTLDYSGCGAFKKRRAERLIKDYRGAAGICAYYTYSKEPGTAASDNKI